MSQIININKSQRATPSHPETPSVTIVLDTPLADGANAYGMRAQAAQLASTLFVTLPGGVYDALLAEMMQRRASVFHVSLASLGRKQDERDAG